MIYYRKKLNDDETTTLSPLILNPGKIKATKILEVKIEKKADLCHPIELEEGATIYQVCH